MSERLLTIPETASEFNVTTGLLYAAVAHGDLPAIRFRARGRIRLKEGDVREWIERHASTTARQVTRPLDLQNQASAVPSIEQFLPAEASRRFS